MWSCDAGSVDKEERSILGARRCRCVAGVLFILVDTVPVGREREMGKGWERGGDLDSDRNAIPLACPHFPEGSLHLIIDTLDER